MSTAWVRIDGEEYAFAEAELLVKEGLVERCPHAGCDEDFHNRQGILEADLLATLERAGLVSKKSR